MMIKLKSFILKIICAVTVLSMLLPMCVFAEDPWDSTYNFNSNLMKFTPEENYVSEQNPPSFKWGKIEECTDYELIVAKDSALTDVVYNKKGIEDNYFNPETTLPEGISLYWAVRYTLDGRTSTWSTVRKFRILPDSYVYTMPPVEELMARIPDSHPRIWLRPEELEEFRSYKDKYEGSKMIYDYVIETAEKNVADNIIDEEPERKTEFATYEEEAQYYASLNGLCLGNLNRAFPTAYAYLLTGDERYGDYAKRAVLSYVDWDWENGVSSWELNNQPFRAITYKSAMIFDWIYPMFTEQEKSDLVEMIGNRLTKMVPLLESIERMPYDSMGWTSYGYVGIAAVALYDHLPAAEGYLRQLLKGYAAIVPNWSYQDGGWSQGTAYCWYSTGSNTEFMEVLARAGIVNLYETAWQHNAYKWSLYTHPFNSRGSFGDGAADVGTAGIYKVRNNATDLYFIDDPETAGVKKWLIEKNGGLDTNNLEYYWLAPKVEETASEEPNTYPLAHEFNDEGWIIMQSDLIDPNRVMMTFKSSPFGSYNHSHADNNGFVLEAFGERLAINAGTYDSYMSPHHKNFTHQTFAHNTITVDNKGQPIQDITAKGKLTGFLHQQDFDLAMGDATDAYNKALGKFERSIIYIRPDIFVIVDDLEKAVSRETSKFQWWINAEHEIEVYEEGNGARINENGAMVDITVSYPEKVTTYYNDIFAGPDMVENPPTVKNTNMKPQTRVWFETEPVEKTKMVVTLDVHKEGDSARYVDTSYHDGYVKMIYEDGTVVIVNTGDDDKEVVTKDGFSFVGTAICYNDESIMLVGGTSLKQGDTDLITLEKRGSVVMGLNELGISTYEDNRISINTSNDYVDGVTEVTNYYGTPISAAYGITYESGKLVAEESEEEKADSDTEEEEAIEKTYTVEPDENYVTFTAEIDNYQLMLNGKLITAEEQSGTISLDIDGTVSEIPINGYIGRSGDGIYMGQTTLDGAKYQVVDMNEELTANALYIGAKQNISDLSLSTSTLEGNYLKLTKVPIKETVVKTETDYDTIKENLAWFCEAENWKVGALGASPYTTRPWLSNGQGVQFFDEVGSRMVYDVEVPEEGDYNLVIKYVSWGEGGTATRSFNIDDGMDYSFTVELTEDYGTKPEIWRAAVIDEPVHLTAGKHLLNIDVMTPGMWNIDWVGLIKK